jgi:hypothetical protein
MDIQKIATAVPGKRRIVGAFNWFKRTIGFVPTSTVILGNFRDFIPGVAMSQ